MSQEKAVYLKIHLGSIHPTRMLTFNVYVHINGHHTLYLRIGEALTAERAKSLASKVNGDYFFVDSREWSKYKEFIHEQIRAADISVSEKAKILRSSSIALIEELYEQPDVNLALNSSKPIIENFVLFMEAEPEAMGELIGLSGHDFYTYNHSLDVSIYALGLGRALGMIPEELEELGLGALFHDIGKRNIHLDILCKKGALSKDEWAIMQQHTQYGYVILKQNPQISDAIKAACFEHHESFQGGGYPQQIQGQEIHPHARIVALADTYDALTTQRSYNVPLMPMDALALMKDQIHRRFDPEMLKALHSVLFKISKAS